MMKITAGAGNGRQDASILGLGPKLGVSDTDVSGRAGGRVQMESFPFAPDFPASLTSEERARRQIGRELHDSLGARLSGMSMISESVHRSLRDYAGQNEQLNSAAAGALRLRELALEVIECAQRVARGESPSELESSDIGPALVSLADDVGALFRVDCQVQYDHRVRFANREVAIAVYRIAQEALTNAVKHGQPEKVWIHLNRGDAGAVLTVADSGKGMSPSAERNGGMGMKNMKARAMEIGAQLKVGCRPGGGTLVICHCIPESHDLREDTSDS
jgi:signal transduction histidine kinase